MIASWWETHKIERRYHVVHERNLPGEHVQKESIIKSYRSLEELVAFHSVTHDHRLDMNPFISGVVQSVDDGENLVYIAWCFESDKDKDAAIIRTLMQYVSTHEKLPNIMMTCPESVRLALNMMDVFAKVLPKDTLRRLEVVEEVACDAKLKKGFVRRLRHASISLLKRIGF